MSEFGIDYQLENTIMSSLFQYRAFADTRAQVRSRILLLAVSLGLGATGVIRAASPTPGAEQPALDSDREGAGPGCETYLTITQKPSAIHHDSTATFSVEYGELQVGMCRTQGVGPDPASFRFYVNDVDRTSFFNVQEGEASATAVPVAANVPNTVVATTAGWNTDLELRTDSATASFTSSYVLAGPPQAPTVDVTAVNAGPIVDRDLCLTMKVGPDAAYECGDLRLVHQLPAVRTLNKLREPTLVYSSQVAHPWVVVGAHVTQPATGRPDSIVAKLVLAGDTIRGKWLGTDWNNYPSIRTRRIALSKDANALATGVHSYTLQVTNFFETAPYPAATASGQLIVVNRASSPFGAGWWLSGLEQLDVNTKLWVDGHGSAYVYQPTSDPAVFLGPSLQRPDTLRFDAATNGFVRSFPGGAKVVFDSLGRHVATVNRLGHTTTFQYSGSTSKPTAIVLPPNNTTYQLQYDPSGARITSIVAPGSRTSSFLHVNGALTQITEPADPNQPSTTVQFRLDPVAANRVIRRVDRKGDSVAFGFDAAARMRTVNRFRPSVTTTIRAGESQGIATGSALAAVDSSIAATFVDGPRTTVGDTMRIWLDRFGAPRRQRDAIGGETRWDRLDSRFPATVTRVRHANGRVVNSVLNQHGLDSLVIDSMGMLATAQAANPDTTRYLYDSKWQSVTRIRRPAGDSLSIAYDPVTGSRLYEQDGRGSVARINYFYDTTTLRLLDSIKTPLSPASRIYYDAIGNVSETRTPLGFATEYLKDALGRDTAIFSPIDIAGTKRLRQQFRYDVKGRVTSQSTVGPAVSLSQNAPGDVVGGTRDSAMLTVATFYDREGQTDSVVRTISPDITNLGRMVIASRWDGHGRKVKEIAPDGKADSVVYDEAGNAVQLRNRRGFTISNAYDALNRLVARTIPSYSFVAETIASSSANYGFPRYGCCQIAAQTDSFAYDTAGNQVYAGNGDARVHRQFNLNGTLAVDSLAIRNYGSPQFGHSYVLRYRYDRNGRRTVLKHPAALAPSSSGLRDSVVYTYDDATGLLRSVVDLDGQTIGFRHDLESRIDSIGYPGGVKALTWYDDDGRVSGRTGTAPEFPGSDSGFIAGVVYADTLLYDARGKVLLARTARTDVYDQYYDGLGGLVHSRKCRAQSSGYISQCQSKEFYWLDALGNRDSLVTGPAAAKNNFQYEIGTGRLLKTRAFDAGNVMPLSDTSTYDFAGNLHLLRRRTYYQEEVSGQHTTVSHNEVSRHYYRADGKLAMSDKRSDYQNIATNDAYAGAFEDYRYDALGRRILRRTRMDPNCQSVCSSFIERIVWDGDQILHEIHQEGHDSTTAATLENDVAFSVGNQGIRKGRVAYVYGQGIDAPLSVSRLGYNFAGAPSSVTIYPHANWRGEYDAASYATGAAKRCRSNLVLCYQPNWKANNVNAYGEQRAGGTAIDAEPNGYFGSVLLGMRDASGNVYRRNRYYDPASGRFTQEDPIGLAGGINLYAFAGSDPVNHSDPFGLCVPWPGCALAAGRVGAGVGTLVGAGVGALGGGVGAVPGAVIGNRVGWVIGAAGATLGAIYLATQGDDSWEGLGPDDLKGKSPEEIEEKVPSNWVREPSRTGGTRYKHPDNRGEQIRVQPGKPTDPNPGKQGPYCKISRCGKVSDPIPLKGNPTLPQP